MLQAFVDGSGSGDSRFLVIAGFIAPDDVWAAFSEAWEKRLSEAQLPFFKMNQMANKPEIAGWFYRTIEEFDIKASIACVINTSELLEVEKSIKYPSYIKNVKNALNPFYFGFKCIIGTLADNQQKLNLFEPINFTFDDQSEKVRILASWDNMTRASPEHMSKLIGNIPIFSDDIKTMPLQAADLYAWWVFKWTREGVADWANSMPFPWELKRKIPRIVAYFGKRSFLYDISISLEKTARTPQELAYAKSLMPEEWRESNVIPTHF
jgi:hypothetical protein